MFYYLKTGKYIEIIGGRKLVALVSLAILLNIVIYLTMTKLNLFLNPLY